MTSSLRRGAFLTVLLATMLLTSSSAIATNTALQFDGSDFLTATGVETLNPTAAITIEVWCLIPGPFMDLGNCPLIEKPHTSHQSPWYQYHLGVNSTSREFLFDLAIDGQRQLLRSPLQALPYSQWVHVAGTYDGAMMRLYVDGVEVSQRQQAGLLTASDTDLIIGRYGNFNNGIVGLIDEVRIWETARTLEQIQQMACAKLTGSEAGLVACWGFDEGSGLIAADCSPNGHDATRGGTAGDDAAPAWTEVEIPQCVVETIDVVVDVKPESDENRVNCNPRANGVVPVAILTTADFDATTVDHTTVFFGPGEAPEAHANRHGIIRHETDVDGDGDLDLLFHFRFGESGLECGDGKATLTGETYDGQSISGTDMIETNWDQDKGLVKDREARVTPNPFNPKTTVSFFNDQPQRVRVVVYDISGRMVANLTDLQYDVGRHSVTWQGRDSAGMSVPSGQYFFRIEAGRDVQIKKALLLK